MNYRSVRPAGIVGKVALWALLVSFGSAVLLPNAVQSATVDPGIGYTNAFEAQPPATDWATMTRTGNGGDLYSVDAEVGPIPANGFTAQTSLSTANPPNTSGTATWSQTGQYLQTRPTGNRATLLVGKFVNNTGTNATEVTLSYLRTIVNGGGAEEIDKGTRVYFSLSGLANQWTNLSGLNSLSTENGTVLITTNLALVWPNGASLFFLWADDNAEVGTDAGNQIDNFSLRVTAGSPVPTALSATLLDPTNNAVFAAGVTVTARAATALGSPPYRVEYFTNSVGNPVFGWAGSNTTAPYLFNLGQFATGNHSVYARAMDNAPAPATAYSQTNTFSVVEPLTIAITSPTNDATYENITSVIGTASILGGTGPYSVQYYLDGAASGMPLTSAPYQHDFGMLAVGDHTIYAIVTDARGWTSNSAVHVVHISGPLAVSLTPTNGTVYNFGSPVALIAAGGGGTRPYIVSFFTNNQLVGTVSASPFAATNIGILPEGSYTSYVHAVDSSVPTQQASSTTNVLTIVPNPLIALLTTPTNGQAALSGQAFTVRATALVGAPVDVTGVEFFLDDGSIRVDISDPYSAVIANPTPGIHRVYAVATDSLGRQTYTETNQLVINLDPIGNNHFSNAWVLAGISVATNGTTANASKEAGEPNHANNQGGRSVWYKWTAPTNGQTRIDTFGSTVNTLLGVYTGSSVSALTLIAANNNAPGTSDSLVEFQAAKDATYYIAVDVQRGGGGPPNGGLYRLNLAVIASVSITSITNGQVFLAGTPIPLVVEASVTNPPVTRVDFYHNGVVIASDDTEPFGFVVTNAVLGTNVFTAVATDNGGASWPSAPVNVAVLLDGVTIVTPQHGSIFINSAPVSVTAAEFLQSGFLTNVDFYVDGLKFTNDAAGPFNVLWPPESGIHTLSAIAIDNNGLTYTSAPVTVSIPQSIVRSNSFWRYVDTGTNLQTAWIANNFDDNSWSSGRAQFGYGDGDEATIVSFGPNSGNKYITTYFRQAFNITNVQDYLGVFMWVLRDDGAIVYLNGQEASRFNIPDGPVNYLTLANNAGDDGRTLFPAFVNADFLVEGRNVVAVEIHQDQPDSSDISFDMELLLIPAIPPNRPPNLALLTPTNNASFIAPSSITLTAIAMDPDPTGSVAKVEFFVDGVKLGETNGLPYTIGWSNPAVGWHVLHAVATDNVGASAASKPVLVAVYDSAGTPLVSIASPQNNSVVEAPTNVTIIARAEAPNGVTNVQFFAGTNLIGTSADAVLSPRADFQFQNSLTSSIPTGAVLGNLGNNLFETTTVDGISRTVLRFAQNDGVFLSPVSAVVSSNVYTIALLFSFDNVTSWRRIIDFKNASTDNGLYQFNGSLYLYPEAAGPQNVLQPNTFVQMVLTRDASSNVVGYIDGIEQFTFVDLSGVGVSAGDVLRFFRDDNLISETSAGVVARLRFYDVALTAAQVAELDRLPLQSGFYRFTWNNASVGTNILTAVAHGASGINSTSAPVTLVVNPPPPNLSAPAIAAVFPPRGDTVTSLNAVQVTFTERVVGVNSGDLLINGNPANNVSGSGSNYTFTFFQPVPGTVAITWASAHGIVDTGFPPRPFDTNEANATWSYNLVDQTPPALVNVSPLPGTTLTNLSQITVLFSEAVTGVDAGDLLVNGAGALSADGAGGQYTFTFLQPPPGIVNFSWSASHGIADLGNPPNLFNASGITWSYILDPRTVLAQTNAAWQFIKGRSEASNPINAWRQIGFDDSGWSNALSPFFYGDQYNTPGNPGTELTDMRGGYSSIYLRRSFVVPNASAVTNLFLLAQSDDGFIAWINGREVARYNMPEGEIPYNGETPNAITEVNGMAPPITQALPNPAGYLVDGTNILAVHAFNNQPFSSSDFGFNAQLFAYVEDPRAVAPRVATIAPPAGDVSSLTNLTIKFTEGVSGIDAGDLLVNGTPAAAVTSTTNTTYTFSFSQPAYGQVHITWAAAHAIADFDDPPKAFNPSAPGATFRYSLVNPNAPTVALQSPLAGSSMTSLVELTVTFSEVVTGVNASDLLVNGLAATNVSGSGATYTFQFAQPVYGTVSIGWAANAGIQDTDSPANVFDGLRPANLWTYTLIDQAPPTIVTQDPLAGLQVTNLTRLTITFSEPVTGVNASDLLVNGTPATVVQTIGCCSYTFSFAQPNATTVTISWANNHGIRDLAPTANTFNAAGPGATWSYRTPDNVPPAVSSLAPPSGATVRSLTQIIVTFSEPVSGVNNTDLLINDRPAQQVSGSGAGPYAFSFFPPSNGVVEARWVLGHGITDLANPANAFAGGGFTYFLDPTATFAGQVVINEIMFNPISGRVEDEWVELHNVSSNLVNLAGWQFNRGLNFTFPNVAIPAGGYLVVAANLQSFQALYPEVVNVAGASTNWGRLANNDETIEIVTALGEVVDSIHYATEGDWARRESGHGAQLVESIVRNGTTATVTVFGHGFSGTDQILISGAEQPEFNGLFSISGITSSSFNISVPDTGPFSATGIIVARHAIDNGASGWSWFAPADGFASSLELINPAMPNEFGQNWAASTNFFGTPGAANSVLRTNTAPLLVEVTHFPAVPRSTQPVAITARVLDEMGAPTSVTLHVRTHTNPGPGSFGTSPMFDDGAHQDGIAGDGLYGAVLPPSANGTIVEFYVQATDAAALSRTWPAPALDVLSGPPVFGQFANALYQVDDENITTAMPAIRVVMTGTERAMFAGASRNSDAEMNVTMISADGDGTKVRYLSGVRVRGAGSRSRTPPNNRVNIPNDNRWNGLSAINLNGQYVHAQVIGSAVAQKSGLPASDARVIQYRINGVNPAPITAPVNGNGNSGAGYGTFVLVEPVNGDLAADLFPEDGNGNVYRASTGNHNADLSYRGTNPTDYLTRGYMKTSNQGENDWTDLMNLTFAFSQIASEEDYIQAISTNVNVLFWMRYFAVGTLVNFGETSLFNGRGDDYAMYRGVNDPRFVLIGHDFDTIFGQGDTTGGYAIATNSSIYIMLNPPNTGGNAPNVPLLRRFLTNAAFAPIFYAELKRLTDTVFHPSQLNPLMDQILAGWGTGPTTTTINAMKNYAANRRANVIAQIPLQLTAVAPGLVSSNGYLHSATPSVGLTGVSHAIETRKVLVNGVPADWSPWQVFWAHNATLQPGLNRVLVQSMNSNDVEFARATIDIWYDDGSVQDVSGTLGSDTAWTAANGPYNVTADVTVPAGVTLTIQPGTTIYLAPGVDIIVANGGRLLAEGTDTALIRFGVNPRVASPQPTWGGITINGSASSPETRITHAHFAGNGDTAIHSVDGTVFLSHLTFSNTAEQYLSLDRSSFVVQDSVFPPATAQFELVHGGGGIKAGGRGIFLRNFFGKPIGYNDTVDFSGGNRPGPIVQFINNVFAGTDDDILDLDSTDAWVERNIFMHVHRNGSPDSASAISGGADNADTSEITIVGNLFYDVDHAALAKQGNFYTFINNTVVHQTKVGSQDTNTAVIIVADDGTQQGAGVYLEGNVIHDAENLVRNLTTALVTYTNNIVYPFLQHSNTPALNYVGNRSVDPLLAYVPQFAETTNFTSWSGAQVLWDWFALQAGSPAAGAGPHGRDLGAVIPPGISISGEPVGITPFTSAVLDVGVNRTGNGIPSGAAAFPDGSGYTHYRWRLDGGAWSAETPVATPITLSNLSNGPHYVEVVGKRDSGFYGDDAVYGSDAGITISRTWVVDPDQSPLLINEVLASNDGSVPYNGGAPDLVELYNPSDIALDLSGVRLTDDMAEPDKFIFPAGTTIPSRGFLVVYADNPDGSPGHHLGFGLNELGDGLFLFAAVGNGGVLLDSVRFGMQLVDMSIGREPRSGEWTLTIPTFGAANQPLRLGDPRALRINEWLAIGVTPFENDFIELYNSASLPVALGGLYLSDEIIGWPTRHRIADLSFIRANGYLRFFADGDTNQGAEHLNFSLSADQGAIGLFAESPDGLALLDCIIYQPQRPNISQGRSPNGSSAIVFFNTPTPGSPNPLLTGPDPFGGLLVINEVLANNASIVEGGRTPDWVELYNGSTNTINLSGLSLSDDSLLPRRFVFPAGAQIAPGAYRRVLADNNQPATTNLQPVLNTGFGLRATGGAVYLFDSLANGGGLLNAITYGIQTPDLSIGRVPAGGTNWVLTSPTPDAPNSAIQNFGNAANLRVNEWLASAPSGEFDWFEIYNPNPQPVALGGLYLTDDLNARQVHQIAPLSFIGSGTNAWLRFHADNNTGAGADHVSFALSASQEAVGISTADGTLIDGVEFSGQVQGVSEGRFPDGSNNIVPFPGTDSPGAPNWLWLTDVVINEALTHTDDPLEDAIELHNLTAQPIDVGSWWLSDDNGTLRKYQIPSPSIIPPFGFLVVYENVFTNRELAAFPFALSSGGDEVVLSSATNNALTGYRTRVRFGAAEDGVSFGRYVTSDAREAFVAMTRRTFGVDDPGTVDEFRTGRGATNTYPRVGPVVISEIMYHPPDDGINENIADEYIELHNISTAPVALYDAAHPTNVWHIRDAVDFDFPTGAVINAGEYLLVVSFDPVNNTNALAAFRARYNIASGVSIFGPYDGRLANSSDEIELKKPGTPLTNEVPYIFVDRVRYFDMPPWPMEADGTGLSLTRINDTLFGDDPINWMAGTPNPGPQSAPLDFDGDGIPDLWESGFNLDPYNETDAGLDLDSDRMTNLQEYRAGTDPRNSQSVLRLTSATPMASGANTVVSFLAASNKTYSVLWKEGIGVGAWAKLADVPARATTGIQSVIDPLPQAAARIYDVVTPTMVGPVLPMPAILRSPSTAVSRFGQNVMFDVFAVGNGPLTYQWLFNGNPIAQTEPVLTLTNVNFANIGLYSVTVSDTNASVTSDQRLLALPPRITVQPSHQIAQPNGTVTFTVTAEGVGPLGYRWRRNGQPLAGQTNSTLVLVDVQASDAANYSVIVQHQLPWGRYGTISSNAVLGVTVP